MERGRMTGGEERERIGGEGKEGWWRGEGGVGGGEGRGFEEKLQGEGWRWRRGMEGKRDWRRR